MRQEYFTDSALHIPHFHVLCSSAKRLFPFARRLSKKLPDEGAHLRVQLTGQRTRTRLLALEQVIFLQSDRSRERKLHAS
jgi:hypothetical protein